MTVIASVAARIGSQIAALANRVEEAADLAALVRVGQVPQRSPFAWVVPLGFDGGEADAMAGIYTQETSTSVGVILFVESVGDAAARRALPKVDELVTGIVNAVAGWEPDDDAIGVFEARRGRLVDINKGGLFYQIDFSIQDQLRIARDV
jgi:hypothetical protein